jgi:hypothetical protein
MAIFKGSNKKSSDTAKAKGSHEKQNVQEIANDLGIQASEIARTGSYFRTLDFQDASTAEQTDESQITRVRQQATEHPLTNKWFVVQITDEPNINKESDSDPDRVHRVEPLPYSQNLSLDEALASLLNYENTQLSFGYLPSGPTKQELGSEHVEQFALNEDRIPDNYAGLHPSVGGQAVTAGEFAPEMLSRALLASVEAKPRKKNMRPEDKLSQMFAGNVMVEDFSRLIQNKVKKKEWIQAVQSFATVLNSMMTIQDNRFTTTTKKKGFSEEVEIDGDAKYKEALTTAKSMLEKSKIAATPEEKEKFETFFQQVQLAYEVAYCCFLYSAFSRTPDSEEWLKKLEEQKEYAADYLREIGGSDEDVKRMYAEIVEFEGTFCLFQKFNSDKFNEIGDKYNISIRSNLDLYFMPETLIEFFTECDEITQKFDEAIALEKKRITTQKSDTPKTDENAPIKPRKTGTGLKVIM